MVAPYRAAHPTIGVHSPDRDTYERLLALRERTGLTFAQLVLGALGQLEIDLEKVQKAGYDRGWEAGWDDGYETARRRYLLTTPCSVCGLPMEPACMWCVLSV